MMMLFVIIPMLQQVTLSSAQIAHFGRILAVTFLYCQMHQNGCQFMKEKDAQELCNTVTIHSVIDGSLILGSQIGQITPEHVWINPTEYFS